MKEKFWVTVTARKRKGANIRYRKTYAVLASTADDARAKCYRQMKAFATSVGLGYVYAEKPQQ